MLFALITFFLFASAISANKIILYTMNPMFLVGIRMLSGGSILLALNYLYLKQKFSFTKIKENIYLLFLITLCTTFVPSLLKAYGLKHMISSKAAFFGALDPFATAIFAYFIFSERLTFNKIVGMLLGFSGAMILLVSRPETVEFKAFAFISYPEIAVLSAIIIGRFGWIMIQRLLKNEVYTPVQVNTITMIMSGVISILVTFLYGGFKIGSLEGSSFDLLYKFPFTFFDWNEKLLFFIFYTIIIGNVIAYNFYGYVLKKHSAVFVSLISFSVPIFVHLNGWLFLGEKLSMQFFIACFITFIGFLIFYKDERKLIKSK